MSLPNEVDPETFPRAEHRARTSRRCRREQDGRLRRRLGIALVELAAIVVVAAVIAALVVPWLTGSNDITKEKANDHNRAVIHTVVERYFIETGEWPADDLSDIGRNRAYFPAGLPINPIDGTSYQLDPATHRVR